ncbi:MAG: hypothetical protein KF693_04035 [Nitrospira sp.]|nr:hypothetical protein [Nitrospira sp.]
MNPFRCTCIGSHSADSIQSVEDGQVWLCEILRNGMIPMVVVLFSRSKRGALTTAQDLLRLYSKSQAGTGWAVLPSSPFPCEARPGSATPAVIPTITAGYRRPLRYSGAIC